MDYCSTDNKYPDSNRSLLLFQSLGSFLPHTVKHSGSGIGFCCDQNDSKPLQFFRQPLIPFRILRLLQILQTCNFTSSNKQTNRNQNSKPWRSRCRTLPSPNPDNGTLLSLHPLQIHPLAATVLWDNGLHPVTCILI